jgi:hypothetical protein
MRRGPSADGRAKLPSTRTRAHARDATSSEGRHPANAIQRSESQARFLRLGGPEMVVLQAIFSHGDPVVWLG